MNIKDFINESMKSQNINEMTINDKIANQRGQTLNDLYASRFNDSVANKYSIDTITKNDCWKIARKNVNRFQPYFNGKDHEPLFRLFQDSLYGFATLFADKTGAAGHHHNFIGGLMVHTFEMLDILYDTYVMHPKNAMKFNTTSKPDNKYFDFSISAVAILYHDWGKLKEYKHSEGPDDRGRFATAYPMMIKGHIFMSAEQFDKDAAKYGVSEFLADKVTHAILAHHSKLDWGSPVKPITPEARMVCACDLISAAQASGKPSYFYDFIKGDVRRYEEQFYNDEIAPRMDNEKFKDKIKKRIDKADNWEDINNNYFGGKK